jgi:hypothetical protein
MKATTTGRTYAEFMFTLNCLAGESEIHPSFLMENDELPQMIKNGVDYDTLLEFINENF